MALAAVVALQLAACSTPAMIAMALIPDGTLSIMMSHFERESKVNRDQLAALEKKGDWPGIANFAEDNIAKDKLNAVWWMVAGHAYSRQGRHPRAIERYQEVVRLEPEVAEGYTLLAQEYRSNGESRRAVVLLTNAQYAVRESAGMAFLLAESHADLGAHESAAKAYQHAIQLHGQFNEAWAGLALSYVRLGRVGEARGIAKSLTATRPDLAARVEREIAGR